MRSLRMFLLPALAATGLAQAQSYREVAPLPTYFDLSGVSFTSATTGWVSGDWHSLYKTTDGGESWAPISVPGYGTEPLYQITFFNTQLGFISGNSSDIWKDVYRTVDGGATWQQVSDFPLGGSWREMDFVSSSVAFLGANGGLAKSSDGGVTWSLESAYPDCPIIYGMDFRDSLVGLAGGYQESSQQDGIFKTTDGGKTWTQRHTGSANSVVFLTSTVALADFGTRILRSTDAGDTWFPVGNVPTGLGSMARLSSTSVAGVSNNGDVWLSTDGGFTWTRRFVGIGDLPASWNIKFFDAQTGHVVGQGGTILRTTDGGLSWTVMNRGRGTEWNGIAVFDDQNVVLAGYHGYMQRTTDGSSHWEQQLLDPPVFLRDTMFSDVDVLDSNSAYIVGHWGSMFKTSNRGQTWDNLSNSVNPSYYANAVDFTDALHGWVVGFDYNSGPKMYVRRTQDGGLSWQAAALNVPSLDVQFIGQTGYVMTTGQPLYKTNDGGANWTVSLVDTPTGQLYSGMRMSWASANVGYIAGFDGFLAKTTDGGQTWNRVRPAQDSFVYLDVRTIGPNEVWACAASQGGGNAIVIRSLNGGATWTTWNLPGQYTTPYRIEPSPSSVYVAGYQGKVWKFESGEVAPSSFVFNFGYRRSGGLGELNASDDQRMVADLSYEVSRVIPNVQLDVVGTTSATSASQVDIQVESMANRTGASQRIYAYDYVAGAWTLLDTFNLSTSDAVRNLAITANAQRYLSNGQLKIRIEVRDTNINGARMLIQFDRVHWTVN